MSALPPESERIPDPARERLRRRSLKAFLWLARILLFASSAAVVVNALRETDLRVAAHLLERAGPWLASVLIAALAAALLQTVGWLLAFARLDARIGFTRLLLIRMVSEAVYLSMPAGTIAADGMALYLLASRAAIPPPVGLAAIAARRALVVLGNALYVLIAFAIGFGVLKRLSVALGVPANLAWVVLGAACALFAMWISVCRALFSGSLVRALAAGLSRIPQRAIGAWFTARHPDLSETDRQLGRLLHVRARTFIFALGCYVASWLVEALEGFVILYLLGSELGFTEVLSMDVLVSLLRSLAFLLPAGLGVQEAGYLTLLQALGQGDAGALAVAFTVAKRLKELFWIAIGYAMLKWLGSPRSDRGLGPPV